MNFINPPGQIAQLYNPSATYRNFKYQEQELQETGFYAFKWRNYDPSTGRFFNVDPLSEKYNTWSPYTFSGNRVIDARELEGLEPIITNKTESKMSVDYHVNVLSQKSSQEINNHLNEVSSILSQNSSLSITFTNDPKATQALDLNKSVQRTEVIKDDKGNVTGLRIVQGETIQGNALTGTINSNGDSVVTAHEFAHALGNSHIWEDPKVSNTPENCNNLLNTPDNNIPTMKSSGGTDLTPSQVDVMKKTIELVQPKIQQNENKNNAN